MGILAREKLTNQKLKLEISKITAIILQTNLTIFRTNNLVCYFSTLLPRIQAHLRLIRIKAHVPKKVKIRGVMVSALDYKLSVRYKHFDLDSIPRQVEMFINLKCSFRMRPWESLHFKRRVIECLNDSNVSETVR